MLIFTLHVALLTSSKLSMYITYGPLLSMHGAMWRLIAETILSSAPANQRVSKVHFNHLAISFITHIYDSSIVIIIRRLLKNSGPSGSRLNL